jgi:hypothetical protein
LSFELFEGGGEPSDAASVGNLKGNYSNMNLELIMFSETVLTLLGTFK